ncbi:hypothetical protein Tco_0965400 [Tanacetum coccineum]
MVKRVDRQLCKFKEGDFVDLYLNDIEDMLLFAIQHKLFHLNDSDIVDFIVALRMLTRSLIIKRHFEDLQLGVESYQITLNITAPQKTFPKIKFKELYTPSYKPPGTVRDELHHRILDFRLGYNDEMSRRNQNRRVLHRDIPLDRLEVLRYDTKGVKVRKGKIQTKTELTLEQTQQGVSDEVLVSIEGVEESKRNVKIKGEKKESLRDDIIACLDKAMAFMSTIVASCFPSTNNPLRTSSNLRNQATIQDSMVTVQQVQGRQGLLSVITARVKGIWQGSVLSQKRPRTSAWFKEKMLLVHAQESGQVLDEEQLEFLIDLRIPDGQAVLIKTPQNAAFQTNDLDAYDSNYDDISSAKEVLMANLSSYDSDVLSELNKLAEDFGKHFVSQMQLSAEQAFWLPLSNPKSEQLDIIQTPVEIEVPKELPKISLVMIVSLHRYAVSSLMYMAYRMSESVIFKCPRLSSRMHFEIGLYSELNEVKMMFYQIEAVVDQCSADKKYFDIQKKEVSLDNDRLLDHIICLEVMNIVMHVDYVLANMLPADNKCLVNDNLEIKRLEQENDHLFDLLLSQDIVHIYVNSLASPNDYREMQQGYIDEYNENLMLKAELAKKEQMMSTLAEYMIVAGAKNHPLMLDKTIGPLVYPTIEENGQVRDKKYAELTEQEKLQDDCDVQALNIVLQGDDPITCLNKAMAFMSTIVASRFPTNNNQLRTSFNLRNQATIQEGMVTIQQVQGRQGQSVSGSRTKGNATSLGEIIQLESGQVLDEEQLEFLADPGIPDG